MRVATFFGAALAAAALGLAAPAMAANTNLLFRIDVASANFVPGFTPFSFDETFSVGPGSLSLVPSPKLTGAFSTSGDPLTAGLLAGAGLTPADIVSTYMLSELPDSPPDGQGFAVADLRQLSASSGPSVPGYMQDLTAFVTPGVLPPSLDGPGMAAFFQANPSSPWQENANSADHSFQPEYFGTATLLSALTVPEPAAWSLLILGFGAMGGALRRRRRLAFA